MASVNMPLSVQNHAKAPARRAAAGGIAGEQAPLERSPEVVDVAAEAVQPGELVRAPDLQLTLFGQPHVHSGVAVAGLVGVELGEDLQRIGPQRVQQPVAVGARPGDHGLLDE